VLTVWSTFEECGEEAPCNGAVEETDGEEIKAAESGTQKARKPENQKLETRKRKEGKREGLFHAPRGDPCASVHASRVVTIQAPPAQFLCSFSPRKPIISNRRKSKVESARRGRDVPFGPAILLYSAQGAAMISPFARLVDYAVGSHFRTDSRGRVVFLSLISKGQRYFVDSKADEEKLRALVGMYRGANLILTLLCYLAIIAPTSIGYNLYAGAIPLRTKLKTAAGTGLFWMLFFGACAWMLWGLYKKAVVKFTYGMKEVGPGDVAQLSKAPAGARRAALLFLLAGSILVGFGLLAAVQYAHR